MLLFHLKSGGSGGGIGVWGEFLVTAYILDFNHNEFRGGRDVYEKWGDNNTVMVSMARFEEHSDDLA